MQTFDASNLDREATLAAVDNIIGGLERLLAGMNSIRSLVAVEGGEEDPLDFDPADPANKYEVGGLEKLTDRGIEICYRLFDAGKTRYAVASLMNISFGAATHRMKAWEKAGGINRVKQPLG